MKTIKFIKAHPAGIPEGKTVTRLEAFADRMIEEGYAEEVMEEAPASDPETTKSENPATDTVKETTTAQKETEQGKPKAKRTKK